MADDSDRKARVERIYSECDTIAEVVVRLAEAGLYEEAASNARSLNGPYAQEDVDRRLRDQPEHRRELEEARAALASKERS